MSKDQLDLDFEQLAKVLDTALLSEDPNIKRALRGLLITTTLITAEDPNSALITGPVSRVFETLKTQSRRISHLEDEINNLSRIVNKRPTFTKSASKFINEAMTWDEKLKRADQVATYYEIYGIMPSTVEDLNDLNNQTLH